MGRTSEQIQVRLRADGVRLVSTAFSCASRGDLVRNAGQGTVTSRNSSISGKRFSIGGIKYMPYTVLAYCGERLPSMFLLLARHECGSDGGSRLAGGQHNAAACSNTNVS
jgi:hypothetical protein